MNYRWVAILGAMLVLLGACHTDNQVPQPSIVEKYAALLAQYSDSTLLYQQLVDTLVAQDKPLQAAQWCDTAAYYDSKNAAAWLLLRAELQRNHGAPAAAAITYKRYLTYFEADQYILLNLANSLAESADAEALRWCDTINAAYPIKEIMASSHFIKGVYFFETKQYNEAVLWYDKALELRYNFPEAWMEKGYCLYDAGRVAEALAAFEKLTTLQARIADAWYWQAKCHEGLGQKDMARMKYQRALDLNSTLEDAAQALERLK